jgi:hypothetical protein
MNNKRTIGMLVLAVSAVMAATTLVLPSMMQDAEAQAAPSRCAGASSSTFANEEATATSGAGNCANRAGPVPEPIEPPTTP